MQTKFRGSGAPALATARGRKKRMLIWPRDMLVWTGVVMEIRMGSAMRTGAVMAIFCSPRLAPVM